MEKFESNTKKTCYHCGNHVFMKMVHELSNDVEEEIWVGDYYKQVTFYERWYIERCSICENITITLEEWDSETENELYDAGIEWTKNQEVIYPRISFEGKYMIPNNIWSAYESALKVQRIDGAVCMMALRRTLDVMCKDKGETKGNLEQKLKNLANKKIIPPVIDGIASLLRVMGNEAAHGDDVVFPDYIVREMTDYTQIILDYVYILPAKLAITQKRIDKRKGIKTED